MKTNARWTDKGLNKKAKLIWASITPVSTDADFSTLKDDQNSQVVEWNRTAARLMKMAGINMNDLYSLMVTNLTTKRDSLHFNGDGSKLLADVVTTAITDQLPGAKKSASGR